MVMPFGSARERRSPTTYRPTVTPEGSTHVDTFTGTTSSFSRTASGKVAAVAVVRQQVLRRLRARREGGHAQPARSNGLTAARLTSAEKEPEPPQQVQPVRPDRRVGTARRLKVAEEPRSRRDDQAAAVDQPERLLPLTRGNQATPLWHDQVHQVVRPGESGGYYTWDAP
jgi:hypothetical protein